MLEYEIAAIYYFIASVVSVHPYFEEVPEDLLVPCVFYPTPEQDTQAHSVSTYITNFTMYIKFMDISSMKAYAMAGLVLQAMTERRNKIPLVDENGKQTGKHFQLNMPEISKVDAGVYEMKVSWKRYTRYAEDAVILARRFFVNGTPIDSENGEGGEDA